MATLDEDSLSLYGIVAVGFFLASSIVIIGLASAIGSALNFCSSQFLRETYKYSVTCVAAAFWLLMLIGLLRWFFII